jgi:hypothetical protein
VKRRILNVAAAVSLALCVALIALAVRSCWIDDSVRLGIGESEYYVFSLAGEIEFFLRGHWGSDYHEMMFSSGPPGRDYLSEWKMVHFDFGHESYPEMHGPGKVTPFVATAMIPNWALAAPLGFLAWWFRRKARKLVPRAGFAVESAAAQKPGKLHNNLTDG